MKVGNSEGERRCDARCYDAKGGTCDCCCGGKNHGAGLKQAKSNVQELGEQWLDEIAKNQGVSKSELKHEIFHERVNQGELF
jgi:hypothetical protein